MGWNDHLSDSELGNLPPEAWGNRFDIDGPFDPDNFWLVNASKDHQLIAIREWFTARFCDPAMGTPYNGKKGGYLFIHGGPHDPATELYDRFGNRVAEELIQAVIDDLVFEVGDKWAPISRHYALDEYDARLDFEVAGPDEPLHHLTTRIGELKQTLDLQRDRFTKMLVARLVFSALIGVLESFLWETAQYWIEEREDVLRRCVEKLPAFKDQPIKLGEVFEQHAKIRETVKAYLQSLVWHRWDKVGALYRAGLEVTLPSVKAFEQPLLKRHDIVHRSGTDLDGNHIEIRDEDVADLAAKIEEFADQVAQACAKQFVPR